MAQVTVIPLTSFVHGRINADEGRPIPMDESTAIDLERAGLIRIKMAGAPAAAPSTPGKASDDGPGQPSSVSLQAPVSPVKTLHVSGTGGGRGKTGA